MLEPHQRGSRLVWLYIYYNRPAPDPAMVLTRLGVPVSSSTPLDDSSWFLVASLPWSVSADSLVSALRLAGLPVRHLAIVDPVSTVLVVGARLAVRGLHGLAELIDRATKALTTPTVVPRLDAGIFSRDLGTVLLGLERLGERPPGESAPRWDGEHDPDPAA